MPIQDRDLGDDYGWKQVHGDVFRPPAQLGILSSLIGCGFQLALLSMLVLSYSTMHDLYTEYVAAHFALYYQAG